MTDKFLVEGYEFDTIEEANEAKKELEAVKFMMQKTKDCLPQETLAFYKKIVGDNMFKTPVGCAYLKSLEVYLNEQGLLGNSVVNETSVKRVVIKDETAEEKKISPKPQVNRKKANTTNSSATVEKKKLLEEILEKPEPPKPKERPVAVVEAELKKTKDKLTTSLIFNFLLTVGIVAMIYIASTSSNINILNYETAILDKYSSWAQELEEKEDLLEEWEKNLNSQQN